MSPNLKIVLAVLLSLFVCEAFSLRSRMQMSTVAVFGGTGKTGAEVVYQALKAGNKVIVLARDPAKMQIPAGSGGVSNEGRPLINDNLQIIQGSVTDANDVEKVFAAADLDVDGVSGVVVALGGKTKDVGKTMLTDGTTNIVNSMKKRPSLKRIAVVTSIGAGDSEKQAPLMFKALMYTVMKGIFEDKNNQERIFLEGAGKDLEYCLIRPGGLGVGAPTGVINVIDGQAGSIMRSDVASFCLGAVTDEGFPYVRQTPCISSVGGTGWVKEKKAGFDGATVA